MVDADELLRHLDDPGWRVIDCRFELSDEDAGHRGYLDAHIPGAVFADLNKDLAAPPTAGTGRHPLPPVQQITASMQRVGVAADTRVVVYDACSGAMAARCWWLLRWLGHDQVAVLNGGLHRWLKLGFPVQSGEESVQRSSFCAQVHDELLVSTDELASVGSDIAAMNLLDARDGVRYRGELEPIDPVAGHIPGARNQPFTESLTAEGLWRSKDELNALWESQLGPDRKVSSAVMCGSGVTACHLVISALRAGYTEPRLYVGSWSEWIRDSARPVAVGEP